MDESRHPIGLYCTAGKDRTGLIVALLLSALGVEQEAIADDYVLSDTAYDDLNDEKALVGALEQVSSSNNTSSSTVSRKTAAVSRQISSSYCNTALWWFYGRL